MSSETVAPASPPAHSPPKPVDPSRDDVALARRARIEQIEAERNAIGKQIVALPDGDAKERAMEKVHALYKEQRTLEVAEEQEEMGGAPVDGPPPHDHGPKDGDPTLADGDPALTEIVKEREMVAAWKRKRLTDAHRAIMDLCKRHGVRLGATPTLTSDGRISAELTLDTVE